MLSGVLLKKWNRLVFIRRCRLVDRICVCLVHLFVYQRLLMGGTNIGLLCFISHTICNLQYQSHVITKTIIDQVNAVFRRDQGLTKSQLFSSSFTFAMTWISPQFLTWLSQSMK